VVWKRFIDEQKKRKICSFGKMKLRSANCNQQNTKGGSFK
jgi:hypothetical protein